MLAQALHTQYLVVLPVGASALALEALLELVLPVELVLVVGVVLELPVELVAALVELVLVQLEVPWLLVVAQHTGSRLCTATAWGWLLCWQLAPSRAH